MKAKILLLTSILFLGAQIAFTQSAPTNRGLYFDGTTWATIPLTTYSNITYEAWIKVSEPVSTNSQAIISNVPAAPSAQTGFGLEVRPSGRIWMRFGSDVSATFAESTTVLAPNAWYHVAGTYDGSNLRVYVNGILENTQLASGTPTTTKNFTIGSFTDVLYRPFQGQIDQIRIYDSAQSGAQISGNVGSTTPNGAQIFYQFEQGQNQNILNEGSLGATGNAFLGSTATPDANDPLWALRVKNTATTGPESLRQAIIDANTLTGKNYVDFSIQQANPMTVSTLTWSAVDVYPNIIDPIVIDAYSAYGASPNNSALNAGNNAQVRIEISSYALPDNNSAVFWLAGGSDGSILRGLSIYGGTGISALSQYAIRFVGSCTGSKVQGCYIGLRADGTLPPTPHCMGGILMDGTVGGNIVGSGASLLPNEFNIISGNFRTGIEVLSQGNIIQGNYIGLNRPGTAILPNGERGIFLRAGTSNQILNNIISGNGNTATPNFGGIVLWGGHRQILGVTE